MRKIHVPVRQFALPVPRTGSIESYSGYGALPHSGQAIHFAIQEQRIRQFPNYTPEKRVLLTFEKKPYAFIISGRMDGIFEATLESASVIEEIKTAFDVEELSGKLQSEPDHPYRWQLRTYGYLHYRTTGEIPILRFHLVSARNFKFYDFEIDLDLPGYEQWLELRLLELVKETKAKEKIFLKRQLLATELEFPFPRPRLGQRELMETVAENLATKSLLLIQAPTGLGKTIGILFPTLKEAASRGQKLVYVTPKNSQHQVVEEAVEKIHQSGAKVRAVTLSAKSKMCLKAEVLCNPEYCEFAKDYYKKVAELKLVDKLAKVKKLTSRKLKKLGEQYEVCPFELSLEAVERADIVVCDYNYVFSPRSLVGRLAEPLLEANQKPNLVIDEAHNLPTRAQDYFSPQLSTMALIPLEERFQKLPSPFSEQGLAVLYDAISLVQEFGKTGGSRKIEIEVSPFFELEKRIRENMSRYLESDHPLQDHDPVLKLANIWSEFVEALSLTGEEYFQTYQKNAYHESLKVTCCDASNSLRESYKSFENVVAFSATLKPFKYYRELLGFSEKKTKTFEFASPFPKENRKLLIIPQISTKLNERKTSAVKVADVIERVSQIKQGNYIALFPSFDFLKMVEGHLSLPGYKVLAQSRDMRVSHIQNFLDELKYGAEHVLLLAVQGGVFSEGVDYAGEMLIGAFVVGPALPVFDFEREQIRAYFDQRYGKENGFDYTYVYPAMSKAIQSAGRVIRSENERGLIVLMDRRFLQTSYVQTMPAGWFDESPYELVSNQIITDVKNFWDKPTTRIDHALDVPTDDGDFQIGSPL